MEETSPEQRPLQVQARPHRSPLEAPPPGIAQAVPVVMLQVKRLEQTERNPQGGYKFASIDGFLDMMRPILAGEGLFVVWDEVYCRYLPPAPQEKKGWLDMKLAFYLCHQSGEIWGPFYRSVMTMMMGSQSYGSGQSYALKQFYRGIFDLSTGDKEDSDYNPPGYKEENYMPPSGGQSRGQRQQPPRQQQDPTKPSKKSFNYMMKLWTNAVGAGADEERLVEWVKAKFKVKSRAELKKDQVSFIIEVLTKKNPMGDVEAELRQLGIPPKQGKDSDDRNEAQSEPDPGGVPGGDAREEGPGRAEAGGDGQDQEDKTAGPG